VRALPDSPPPFRTGRLTTDRGTRALTMAYDANVLGVAIVAAPATGGTVAAIAYTGVGVAILVITMLGVAMIVVGIAVLRLSVVRGAVPAALGPPEDPGGERR
jgi:hypothetical protein